MIDSVTTATSLLAAYRKPKAAAAAAEDPTAAAQARAPGTPPVSGGAPPAIAPETTGALIEKGQGVAEDPAAGLSVAFRHWMEDIANDRDYAARQAEVLATSPTACMVKLTEGPQNGDPPEVWTAFTRKVEGRLAQAKEVQEKRLAIYKDEMAKGTPPAEIFAKMLKSDLAQPQSYWDAVGGTAALDSTKARLAYLERLLGQA